MPEIKADLPKLCLDIMCNSSFCFGTMIWIPFPVGLLFGFSFFNENFKSSPAKLENRFNYVFIRVFRQLVFCFYLAAKGK